MRAVNVTVMFDQEVRDVELPAGDRGVRLALTSGGELAADAALFCVGRNGNTEELGLAALGIETARNGRVVVNEQFQSSLPNVYAAGDVIGSPALASTSMEQARVAVCHAFGFSYKQTVSDLVPYALYTIPEVSTVGATEQALIEEGRPHLVGRASYRHNPRAQILGDTTGLIKLVFDPDTQRVLGVHIIGEQASELIHIGQACMHFGGTLDFFIQNVFNFPTLSDLYKYAAYDGLGQANRHRQD
jgi:NAD(P) transhydrogenase